jgi:hypothetical protein
MLASECVWRRRYLRGPAMSCREEVGEGRRGVLALNLHCTAWAALILMNKLLQARPTLWPEILMHTTVTDPIHRSGIGNMWAGREALRLQVAIDAKAPIGIINILSKQYARATARDFFRLFFRALQLLNPPRKEGRDLTQLTTALRQVKSAADHGFLTRTTDQLPPTRPAPRSKIHRLDPISGVG